MQQLQIGRVYRHFKGDYYLVEALAKDSRDTAPTASNTHRAVGDLFALDHRILPVGPVLGDGDVLPDVLGWQRDLYGLLDCRHGCSSTSLWI